jgi:signal peptidase I
MTQPLMNRAPQYWRRITTALTSLLAISPLALGALTGCGERSVQAYYMPSESMLPTIQVNDRIMTNLKAYVLNSPQRGDIVMFNPTEKLRQNGFSNPFMKRIIGLPGEQVVLKNGGVYINGKLLQEAYLAKDTQTTADMCGVDTPFLATAQKVPSNAYLVLGDNRVHSFDSRCWGMVPRRDLVSKMTLIYWPLNRFGSRL